MRLSPDFAAMLASTPANLEQMLGCIPSGAALCRMTSGGVELTAANEAAYAMLGLIQKDLPSSMDALLEERVYPDDQSTFHRTFSTLTVPEDCSDLLFRYLRSDASVRWLHIRAKRLNNTAGDDWIFVCLEDVSGRQECSQNLEKQQAELFESREKYQLAIRGAGLGVWEYDIPNRRLISPDHGLAAVGLPDVVEDVPASLVDRLEPRDVPKLLEMYRQVDAGEPVVSCEVWFRSKPGVGPQCQRITYTTRCGPDGHVEKAYGICQDVTTARLETVKYNQILREMLAATPKTIISMRANLTRNRVEEIVEGPNPLPTLRQYEAYDDLVHRALENISLPSLRSEATVRFDRAKLQADFRAGRTDLTEEFSFVREGSDALQVISFRMHMVQNPSSGELELFVNASDVSAERLDQAIIRRVTEAEFDYLALIRLAAQTIEFRSSRDTEFRPFLGMGLPYDGAFLPLLQKGIPDEEHAAFKRGAQFNRVLNELNRNEQYLLTYSCRRGEALERKQIKFCWLDDSRQNIAVLQSDVTSLYRIEQEQLARTRAALLEAERANETRSSFLSNISHDMRTPLNGILGFTDLALETEDPAVVRGYLGKIHISGALLLDLVNDTLTLSRLESGKMESHTEVISSAELLRNITVPIRQAAEEKRVRFRVEGSELCRRYIRADRLNVQKIFLNLLSNAIKFTPPGGLVELKVSLLNPPVNGCNTRIDVCDSGIGISPAFLPQIYEPFLQEQPVNGTGTGLGLAIVRQLVQLLGGQISVKSQVDIGTTFSVELYFEPASGAEAHRAPPEHSGSLTGRRILVCEDNELNLEIARTILEKYGMRVVCACDGKAGLDAFAASAPGEFDAVLMDLRMPVMTGYEAAAAIRALPRADAASVPILAMTADAYAEDVQKTLQMGMNGHIPKPIEPNRLLRELGWVCGRKSAGSSASG